MTAARTKQHKEKPTGVRTEKKERRKQRKKQEILTQGVDSNKASRLCHKAEPGTLPPDLPSCYSRRQLYQVSVLPLSPPPP